MPASYALSFDAPELAQPSTRSVVIGLGPFGLDVAALLVPRLALLRQGEDPAALPLAQVGLVARQGEHNACLIAEDPTALLANITSVQHFVVREASTAARSAYEGWLQRLLGQDWSPLEATAFAKDSKWLKRLILPALADHPHRPLGIARLQVYLLLDHNESTLYIEQIISLLRAIQDIAGAPLVITLIVQWDPDDGKPGEEDLLCKLERAVVDHNGDDLLIHQVFLLSDRKEDFSRSAERGERALVACNFLEGVLTSELSTQLLEYSSPPEANSLCIGTLSATKLYSPVAEVLAEQLYEESGRRLGQMYLAEPGQQALAAEQTKGSGSLSLLSVSRRAVAGLPIRVKPRSRWWDLLLRKLTLWPLQLSSEEAVLHETLLDEVPHIEVDRLRWFNHLRPISPPPEPAGFDDKIDQWWRELIRFRTAILEGVEGDGQMSSPSSTATFDTWVSNAVANLGLSPEEKHSVPVSSGSSTQVGGNSSRASNGSYSWLQEEIARKSDEIATIVATVQGGLPLAVAHLEGYRSKRDKLRSALSAWRLQREHEEAITPPDYDADVLHRRKHSLIEAQAARPHPPALIARLFLTWALSFYIYLRGVMAGGWPAPSDEMVATYGTVGVLIPLCLGWLLVVILDVRLWREKRQEALQARPYLSTLLIRLMLLLLLLYVTLTVVDKWGPSWWLRFLHQNDKSITLAVAWTIPFILMYIVLYGVSSLRVMLSRRRIEDIVLGRVDKKLESVFYGLYGTSGLHQSQTSLVDQILALHDNRLLALPRDGLTHPAKELESLYATVAGTIETMQGEIEAGSPPLLRSIVYHPLAEEQVREEIKASVGGDPGDAPASSPIAVSYVRPALGSSKALAAILRQHVQTDLYMGFRDLRLSKELSLSRLLAREERLGPTYPHRLDELKARSKLLWPLLPQQHLSILKREKMEFLLLPEDSGTPIWEIPSREVAVRPLISCDCHGIHYIKIISGLPHSLCKEFSAGRDD